MCDNAAFKKSIISFLFLISAMFCLRAFKYNNNKVKVKQNKLNLHFGFCVFSYLVAEVADKSSLETGLKENGVYISFSSFTLRIKFKRQQFPTV